LIRHETPATPMTTLQQQIAEKFLTALAEDENFDVAKMQALRRLLAEGKKPKADDLVEIFSAPAGDDVA
jgi:hypothetical protein